MRFILRHYIEGARMSVVSAVTTQSLCPFTSQLIPQEKRLKIDSILIKSLNNWTLQDIQFFYEHGNNLLSIYLNKGSKVGSDILTNLQQFLISYTKKQESVLKFFRDHFSGDLTRAITAKTVQRGFEVPFIQSMTNAESGDLLDCLAREHIEAIAKVRFPDGKTFENRLDAYEDNAFATRFKAVNGMKAELEAIEGHLKSSSNLSVSSRPKRVIEIKEPEKNTGQSKKTRSASSNSSHISSKKQIEESEDSELDDVAEMDTKHDGPKGLQGHIKAHYPSFNGGYLEFVDEIFNKGEEWKNAFLLKVKNHRISLLCLLIINEKDVPTKIEILNKIIQRDFEFASAQLQCSEQLSDGLFGFFQSKVAREGISEDNYTFLIELQERCPVFFFKLWLNYRTHQKVFKRKEGDQKRYQYILQVLAKTASIKEPFRIEEIPGLKDNLADHPISTIIRKKAEEYNEHPRVGGKTLSNPWREDSTESLEQVV